MVPSLSSHFYRLRHQFRTFIDELLSISQNGTLSYHPSPVKHNNSSYS